MHSRYSAGTYNALCDICGFEFKRSEMQKTWNGLLVCREDYDPKHPQLTIRVNAERISVPDARPDNTVEVIDGYQGSTIYAIVRDGETEYEVTQSVRGAQTYTVGRYLAGTNSSRWEIYKSRLARGFV